MLNFQVKPLGNLSFVTVIECTQVKLTALQTDVQPAKQAIKSRIK